jgi:hypothetical protein
MKAVRALVPVVLLAVSVPAAASATPRLAYEAPRGCPSEAEFVAAVAGRGATFEAREATEGRHLMVVSIRRQGDGYAGAFQVRDEADATSKREVHGTSCGEVADALAVVTAIALHAEAPQAIAPETSGTTSSPAAAPAPAPAPFSAEDRLRGSTRAFPPRTETVQVGAGALRFDLQRSATLSAGASFGLIPSVVLPRYDLSLVAANFITTPEKERRISGLVLRLRLGVMGKGTYQSPDTKTDATGLTFGIDVCQSPSYDSKGLVLLFCGGYGGGVMMLRTRGLDGVEVQSKNTGFGEATFSAEAQVHLAAGFHLGLRVGGGFTVGEITAERADGSRIFKSSLWSGYALLGVGVRF